MNWNPDALTLTFASLEEATAFHQQLSELLRARMMEATRHEKDAARAKDLSRLVLQDHAAVIRGLNALRSGLERHGR